MELDWTLVVLLVQVLLNCQKRLSYVFGIDLSFSFILEARKIMHNRNRRNMEFIVADATNLPFKSKFFHSIVALNVIDRLDFNKLIFSVNSSIKKNGKLILKILTILLTIMVKINLIRSKSGKD